MKQTGLWLGCVLGVFVVAGCGDDGSSRPGADARAVPDASVSPDATLTTLRGIIHTDDDMPLAGATVRVFGSTTSTTTTSDGSFSLSVPEGRQLIELQADDHWGRIEVFDAADGELEWQMLSDTTIADLGTALNHTIDLSKGALAVEFKVADDGDGESATLSASTEITFTFANGETPVLSDVLLADGNPVLVFIGVATGTSTVNVQGAPGRTACAAPEGPAGSTTPFAFPVVAKTATVAATICGAL